MNLILIALLAFQGQQEPQQLKLDRIPDEGSVHLKWNSQKGTTFRYETRTTMKVSGMEIEALVGQAKKVLEVDKNGTAILEITIDRFRMSMSDVANGEYFFEYDSKVDVGEPGDAMSKVMAAFVGASYREKVSARGESLEITGIREMTRKMKEGLDEDLREEIRQMGKDPFEGPMENLKNRWNIHLPVETVSPGESWKASTTQTLPPFGELEMKELYTLTEIRNDGGKEAVIKYQTEVSLKSVGDGKLELGNCGGTGMIIWDLERGRLQSYKLDLQMEMSMRGEKHTIIGTYEIKLVPSEDR